MNFYKEKTCLELDLTQFRIGALYMYINKRAGTKCLVCCGYKTSEYVDLLIIETIEGYFSYQAIHLSIDDEYDPDIEINRVLLEEKSVGQICLREEKELLKDLADKLYQRGAVRDDCEA